MKNEAYSITVQELAARGPEAIPEEFIPACHLIYSSPATLSYNSPGAVGFGVKRAGLVIPESVMLLIAPNACGRNSSILSNEESYADRMFYLTMSETDLVTGRHLTDIPEAIRQILDVCQPKPKAVVICLTCADALLGTDLERVCRRATKECGVQVIPSYMYALEREGRKPPMVAIRQTIYSLVERLPVQPDMVNLLGFFTPLDPESEFFSLLDAAGIHTVNQVSAMQTLEEYAQLGAANFNIVLNGESLYAAEDLRKRLNMPYLELHRLYDPERIHKQYRLFGSAVGITIDDNEIYEKTAARVKAFAEKHAGATFAIGEMCNANPYELAAFLTSLGMNVPVLFSNLTAYDFPYVRRLAGTSPETRVFTGISPTMVHYKEIPGIDCAIGKDAADYCPPARRVGWHSEKQPFGYRGVNGLLDELEEALA